MPEFSTSSTAFSLTTDVSMRASASCSSRILRASLIVTCRLWLCFGEELLEHVLEVHLHLLHADRAENLHRRLSPLDGQRHEAVLELAGGKLGLHLFAGPLPAFVLLGAVGVPQVAARQEQFEEPILDALGRLRLDRFADVAANEVDGDLGQIADHRLDVAAMVADLGVLGRLDLEERRPDELGEPTGDLGFADAGRADHDDVLRRHVLAKLGRELLPPPAIADGDRDRPLGRILADDVLVELDDDLSWREVLHRRGSELSAGRRDKFFHHRVTANTEHRHRAACGDPQKWQDEEGTRSEEGRKRRGLCVDSDLDPHSPCLPRFLTSSSWISPTSCRASAVLCVLCDSAGSVCSSSYSTVSTSRFRFV